jgi:predicted acyltransferase (DUF342 family)
MDGGAMNAGSLSRCLRRLTVAAGLLLASAGALAVDYVFPDKMPSSCKGSNGSYTCGQLTLGYDDTITIASPKPATITISAKLVTDNARINVGGAASDLKIIVTGPLTPGYAAVINANIEATSIEGGSAGSVTWGGSITSTSGNITFGYADTVAGAVTSAGTVVDSSGAVVFGSSISTTTGSIALGYGSKVAGTITSTTGAIKLSNAMAVGGSITSTSGLIDIGNTTEVAGSLSTAGAINVQQSARVAGALNGSTGAVTVGYAASVTGAVTTSTGTIAIGGTATLSSCVKSTSSAKITLDWDANVHSVCCGATCGTSCVANNSGKTMPAACVPAALAHWRMDETSWKGTAGEVKDSSGNGYHGTAKSAGGASAVPSAVSGTAAYTSGAQSTCNQGQFASTAGATRTHGYVELGSVPALTSSFTVAAWMRPTTGGGRVVVRDDADNGWAISLGDGGVNRLRFFSRRVSPTGTVTGSGSNSGCGSTFCLDSPAVVPWSQWSFVAVTVDTAAKRITQYVFNSSGTLVNSLSSAYSGTWSDGAGQVGIGGETVNSSEGRSGNGMKGQIDEVQLYASALSQAMLATAVKTTRACTGASGPDHYELSLPSASLSCQASTVTVTACADASSPCTNRYTGALGSTAMLAASAGSLAATTLSFDASGVATTTLSHSAAAQGASVSVTLSNESLAATNARKCCPDGVACAAGNSCSSVFSTAGFIVAASANGVAATVATQTAGTTSAGYVLRAVKTDTATGACTAALTGATSVNWAAQCNNPSTCSVGSWMTLTGSSATAIAGNPATGVTTTTPVAMTFDASGNAPFTFNYADVGQVTLHASKAAAGALLSSLSGATNAFVVKPGGFAVSTVKQTASPFTANPAAANAAGTKFIKAGESFTATVTAQTSTGAAARNFGRETVPEGVLLTPTLVLPAGGAAGSLSNATLAGGGFSSGVATATTLAYSEVGIITLTPSVADGNYLGAGSVSGTASGNVGRFVPARFALASPSVTTRSSLSCTPASTFTYLDENFRLGWTLTAQNSAGSTTQNYTGSFAKLDPTSATSWNLAGIAGSTTFSTATGRLSLGTASGSWSSGVTSGVTLTASATRAASPDGPHAATFGIAPTDSDGVAMATYDLASSAGGANDRSAVGSLALRFGRLTLSSAIGAADRPLVLPVSAQHWNGTAFTDNLLDSCTTLPTSAVSFGNLRRGLTVADTSASAAVTLSAGTGKLTLAAPLGGRSGTFDVALSLGSAATDVSCLQPWTPGLGDAATAGANLTYLRGAWCGSTYTKDPAARATFGQQRGNDALVYRRENY